AGLFHFGPGRFSMYLGAASGRRPEARRRSVRRVPLPYSAAVARPGAVQRHGHVPRTQRDSHEPWRADRKYLDGEDAGLKLSDPWARRLKPARRGRRRRKRLLYLVFAPNPPIADARGRAGAFA